MAFTQYLQILDRQKVQLKELEIEFNHVCDQINADTVKKLEVLDKNKSEEKQKILQAHTQALATALHDFKSTISESHKTMVQELEKDSHNDDEKNLLGLEAQMKNLQV